MPKVIKSYKIHNWIVPCSTFSQTILDLYVPMLDHKAPAVVEMVPRSWQDQAALRASFPTHSDVQKSRGVTFADGATRKARWLN